MNRREFLAAAAALRAAAQQHDTEAFERASAHRQAAAPGWFTRAGLGLFIHWGICNVREVELGWGVFRDVGGAKGAWPVENYIAQADAFRPDKYDPDLWLAAAAKAGFRYAAMTTRHHDGFALWPSDYGNFSTKEHMNGRDLVRPFVEACRRHGLKVGLYYSPGNWLFNPPGWPHLGYPLRTSDFLYRRPERTQGTPRYADMTVEEEQKSFEILYAYVKGQVGELLTRYGKIDLLWWDGYDWPKGIDIHGPETDAWVRQLQPGLVTNDRYRLWSEKPTLGDFSTEFENRNPETRPAGAWEQCEAICGSWAYTGPKVKCKSAAHIINREVRSRAWGGNYLPDFGPRADGTMPPVYYQICEEMAAWRKHSGVSLEGAEPGPYPQKSDVPVTVKGSTWYLHLLDAQRTASVTGQPRPKRALLLRTRQPANVESSEQRTIFTLPDGPRSEMDEVIAVRFA
jgi:alpha-L-fucosidase